MLLKKLQQKTIELKVVLAMCFLFFFSSIISAQEIIKDTVVQKPVEVSIEKKKIDGIIATVGDYIILDSDIDKGFVEIAAQGGSVNDITRCQMLGKLLEDKLYAHQAIQDSIIVSDAEVRNLMDDRLNYMLRQAGGDINKIVEFYKKGSVEEFKTYFADILKEQKLSAEMQKKIVDAVEITPEEVRNFFKKIPKEELPTFGAEMEVAQIVVEPKVSKEDEQKVIDRLNGIRKDVLEGSSFATKAVLYSQIPDHLLVVVFIK